MPLLTRDAILSASDVREEDVPVPEWGGTVRVRGLTGKQRKALSESLLDQKGQASTRKAIDLQTRLPAMCMIGEDGRRLFDDEDVALLNEKSAAALKRVFDVAARLSGLSDDDVEEMSKNSESSQS